MQCLYGMQRSCVQGTKAGSLSCGATSATRPASADAIPTLPCTTCVCSASEHGCKLTAPRSLVSKPELQLVSVDLCSLQAACHELSFIKGSGVPHLRPQRHARRWGAATTSWALKRVHGGGDYGDSFNPFGPSWLLCG